MADVTIPGLPLVVTVDGTTLLEICNTPTTTPTSNRMTLAQMATFFSTNLPSLTIGGTQIASSGNITMPVGKQLTINGTTASPLLQTDPSGLGMLFGGFIGIPTGTYGINADGSGQFATNVISWDTSGNFTFGGGTSIDSSGSLTIAGGVSTLNSDGSASFAESGAGVTIDSSGNVVIGGSLGLNSFVSGFVVISSNSTATVTFNTNSRNETQYDTSGSVLTSATIALPATTVAGQILRYVTKSGVTTVTVTGTVSIGAAITTLAANASVAWQAVDGAGTFIRIQ